MTSQTTPDFFSRDNLIRESEDYLVIALFLRSRSDAFKWAMEIAQQADHFAERDLESMTLYAAAFKAGPRGADLALQLIHYIRGWKGTHFYANGRLIIGEAEQSYHLISVLRCFHDSCSAKDYRAHCHRLIDSPYFPVAPKRLYEHIHPMFRHVSPVSELGTYVFPCAYMLDWFEAQKNHPASIPDQIQAAGVSKCCDVCPRFKADDFGIRAAPTKTERRSQ